MPRKEIFRLVLIVLGMLGVAWVAYADVPPPPVNQTLGLEDTVFNDLSEPVCRACHDGLATSNPDRHHLNMGLAIPVGICKTQTALECQTDAECQVTDPNDYCINDSQAPNAPAPPSGSYECLTCHTLEWNPVTFSYEFAPFRDCLLCHSVEYQPAYPDRPQEANVHHRQPDAVARHCDTCHGSLVNSYDDGHYIPTYDPSLVTPWPSGKTNGGPNGEGNCNFCHEAGGVNIVDNHDTHHGTGLTSATFPGLASSCEACHPPGHGPNHDAFDIRVCELCHGVPSLHNIQADSNGDGITPGTELAYYGHIGNNDDCFGCHGFTAAKLLAQETAPYSGPVVPYIQSADVSLMVAGTDTVVTLTGAAFSNVIESPVGPMNLDSTAEITAQDGSAVSLDVLSVAESQMVVNVPGSLPPGNYEIRAVKGPQVSNPAILSIVPEVTVTEATCSPDGLTAITGSGFSGYVDAADSGTGVSSVVNGTPENADIVSWTDTDISAQFSACPDTVEVSSVFDTVIADVTPISSGWGPASIVGMKSHTTSGMANYAFLLIVPTGIVVFLRRRTRR